MKRTYRYVSTYGDLYRMTERNYRRYLRAGAKDDGVDPAKYGRYLGSVRTFTDGSCADFANELAVVNDLDRVRAGAV